MLAFSEYGNASDHTIGVMYYLGQPNSKLPQHTEVQRWPGNLLGVRKHQFPSPVLSPGGSNGSMWSVSHRCRTEKIHVSLYSPGRNLGFVSGICCHPRPSPGPDPPLLLSSLHTVLHLSPLLPPQKPLTLAARSSSPHIHWAQRSITNCPWLLCWC